MLKLCYIEDCWAYFTSQELSDQTGDDWNDAPYEHNAGEPYSPYRDDEDWEILKVAFDGGFIQPHGMHTNSPWSVDQINRGHVPWLRTWTDSDCLYAGAFYREFVEFIQKYDGHVYLVCNQEFGEHYEDW